MSFNQYNPFQRFRETLKHEDHIHNQIEACRMSFNRGDANEVMYAVESLMLLITPNMIDERFLEEIQTLEDDWQEKKTMIEKEHRKALIAARNGCPDLVANPSQKPDMEHFKKSFMIACALFERRNLMLKVEVEDSI